MANMSVEVEANPLKRISAHTHDSGKEPEKLTGDSGKANRSNDAISFVDLDDQDPPNAATNDKAEMAHGIGQQNPTSQNEPEVVVTGMDGNRHLVLSV